ncbi:hypothetical protein M9458_050722 [Cirrhinus mrigala]|uniref:Gypsy retrotransposon integrase-like protein 1 n=1 Tax=Cirrhinus mrigala TaxID=683832 RepID=A0ABD0MVE9_CIRMR
MVHALRQSLQPAHPPAVSSTSITASTPIARLQSYSGEPEGCSGFLLQCSLYIETNSQSFPNENVKIAFVISLLTGRALQWAEALWNTKSTVLTTLSTFFSHFRKVFGAALTPLSVHDELLKLKQASNNIHEYTLCFRALAVNSGWNEVALLAAYRKGLKPAIRRQMAIYEDTVSLENFIKKAIHISQHLSACAPETSVPRCHSPVRTISQELAVYETICACTVEKPIMSSGTVPSDLNARCLTDLNIPAVENETCYHITTIQGTPLGDGHIDHRTVELELILNGNHSETLTLLVLPRATVDVILGRPGLKHHSPHIDWRSGKILGWSDACKKNCLVTSPTTETTNTSLSIHSTSVESPETTSSVTVPTEYSSYADVFSKEEATHLPPHRREAMENYIQEALKQGFIRPSTSPAASSFFFVAKKDGGLRPCIDYRILNEATVKFAYLLPLVPAALQELREARVFTKLDLRSAYNLIRIREGDEWKTAFITSSGHYEYRVMPYGLANSPSIFQNLMNMLYLEMGHMEHNKVSAVSQWKEPQTIKEIQRFLGFVNFYRRFIKNFSLLATPLTSMLKGSKKTLQWNSDAREAFQRLKQAFTSAPVLQNPDPNKPFVVEVDAADTGVGAVLSQWSGEPLALHPCAYYSKKLTPAEQNYGIGDRELLAIKQALKEWRHWLGGAKHPFQVITDHKNLQYLRSAKRLNARQARWSMFFTRFHFHITYQPKHKNLKADGLSRLYSTDPVDESPEPVLPPSVFLAPIIWQLDDQIRHATLEEAALPGGPAGAHTSLGSGHPDSRRTLSLLRQRYWWPNMAKEVARYVKGCSVCAITTTPRRLPEGKRQPLPIPRRPWTHIGVDFPTDLPPSNGYTTILVVVDRFSKACKLIPLKGLPTALETTEALFQHVFRNFGLPEDIVSDRGPLFISRVWRAFPVARGYCQSLDAGVTGFST